VRRADAEALRTPVPHSTDARDGNSSLGPRARPRRQAGPRRPGSPGRTGDRRARREGKRVERQRRDHLNDPNRSTTSAFGSRARWRGSVCAHREGSRQGLHQIGTRRMPEAASLPAPVTVTGLQSVSALRGPAGRPRRRRGGWRGPPGRRPVTRLRRRSGEPGYRGRAAGSAGGRRGGHRQDHDG